MPSTYHYLTVPCLHIIRVDTWKSTRQLIGCMEGVRVRMGMHLFQNDVCTDSIKVTIAIMIKKLVVQVALQSARYIV